MNNKVAVVLYFRAASIACKRACLLEENFLNAVMYAKTKGKAKCLCSEVYLKYSAL